MSTVIALFADRAGAQEAVDRLLTEGFAPGEIGILEPADVPNARHQAKRDRAGILLGGWSLAIVGGVMGPFVMGLSNVAGAVVAAVVGLALGGYAGAILGGLFSRDRTGEDEPYYMMAIRAGRVLVSAEVGGSNTESMAANVLNESNALEVDSLGDARLEVELRHPAGQGLGTAA